MLKKSSFIDLAKKLAAKSDHPAHKLACVIAKRGKIVSIGWNQLKTHPKSPHRFKSIHAEFKAILGVSVNELKDSTAYVYRERKDGTLGKARPCESCFNMLRQVGIKEVYYTTYGGYEKERIS